MASSRTYAEHAAYSESNIPAIIQHAEQARRHNAIRPRSKGAREDRRESERESEREGRESRNTMGCPRELISF